jgi:hypothetical protein
VEDSNSYVRIFIFDSFLLSFLSKIFPFLFLLSPFYFFDLIFYYLFLFFNLFLSSFIFFLLFHSYFISILPRTYDWKSVLYSFTKPRPYHSKMNNLTYRFHFHFERLQLVCLIPSPAASTKRQLPHPDRQNAERERRGRVVRRWRACTSLKVPVGAEARSKGGAAWPGGEPPFRHRPPARHHGSYGGSTSLSFLLRLLAARRSSGTVPHLTSLRFDFCCAPLRAPNAHRCISQI